MKYIMHVNNTYDAKIYIYQISDDEDDTHPNIDTPSLFRWRHQARLERMEERRREQEEHERKKVEYVNFQT